MNNQSIMRYSGMAAIVSAVLYVMSLGVAFSGSAASLGGAFYIASSLLFLAAIFVLYLDLRQEAALPALLALTLLGAVTVWSLFLDPMETSPIFEPLTMAYGIGFVLFGWLQRTSSRYPSNLGNLAITTGVIALIASIALIAGVGANAFGLLNLLMSVPYIIWLVLLGRHFLKEKATGLHTA